MIRYLHTQLLLHRQVFVALTRRKIPVDFKEDSFLHAVVGASVRQCVDCSEKLIDVLDATFESKAIGAWWYNITCKTH
jgi:hypothetical protein